VEFDRGLFRRGRVTFPISAIAVQNPACDQILIPFLVAVLAGAPLTVIVTAKVNDGIVLAADSAASFFDADGHALKIYNNANKIFNLVKVWPIGAMVYGAGGIGSASVETLTKDLRKRFGNHADGEYYLNPSDYTIEEVAKKARKFLFETCFMQAYPEEPPKNFLMGYRVCGYSAQSSSSEVWEFMIIDKVCPEPYQIQGQLDYGRRRDRPETHQNNQSSMTLSRSGKPKRTGASVILFRTEDDLRKTKLQPNVQCLWVTQKRPVLRFGLFQPPDSPKRE
jgi:hypothetical protein